MSSGMPIGSGCGSTRKFLKLWDNPEWAVLAAATGAAATLNLGPQRVRPSGERWLLRELGVAASGASTDLSAAAREEARDYWHEGV